MAGPHVVDEFRQSPAQRWRAQLLAFAWFAPYTGLIVWISGTDTYVLHPWKLVVYGGVLVLGTALGTAIGQYRAGLICVRVTHEGFYDGRVEGHRMPWLAPRPVTVSWDDVIDVRVIEGWGSKRVEVFRRSAGPHTLQVPSSRWLNPDPEFDHRLALLRVAWVDGREPLPPPPPSQPRPPAPPSGPEA